MIAALLLTLTTVSCGRQGPSPALDAHQRRLHATSGDDDGAGDAGWHVVGPAATAAAAAAGLTSLIAAFALCTCCPPYRSRR